MRHPRHLLPASLLLACTPDVPSVTDSESGSSGSTGEPTTTAGPSSTTEEPVAPEIPEGRYVLRIDDTRPPDVGVELDKAHALELFGDSAKDIKLLEVDSTALLNEVLARIQASCGDKWKDNNKDPLPNCAATELGKTYGPEWRRSPQYRMVSLLTMTPANANVRGTSLSDFEQLFVKNPNLFKVTFAELLAGSLFCSGTAAEQKQCAENPPASLLTRPFIPTELLGDILKKTLLASHPNIGNDQGLLPVTLYDALKDMQPLSEKLGPVGDHPGLLVPDDADFTTYSDALTPQFKMLASASSNLRRVEGIDASVGKGEMSISLLPSPLSFDFTDASKVQFEGLAEVPTVDMRMAIAELDTRVPACEDGLAACSGNLPESPVGDQYVWSTPLWSFERIVGAAAQTAYADRSFDHCYVNFDPCLAQVSIGAGTDPKGWGVFQVDFQSVKVPKPQYLWELLLTVAQIGVHDFECVDTPDYDNDGNKTETIACAGPNDADPNNDPDLEIPEGSMRPVYALYKVPLGLTADDLIAQLRPTMQTQADTIADTLAGNYWNKSAHLDFYYRRADIDDASSPTYLFFVAESDKRPDENDPSQLAAYGYAKPGFFTDAALTTKASATEVPGVADTEHEKLLLPEGVTELYMQDDAGDTYHLRFTVPPGADPVEIVVRVTKV